MKTPRRQTIPAPAASVSGIIAILIGLLQFILRLFGLLPSSDELML